MAQDSRQRGRTTRRGASVLRALLCLLLVLAPLLSTAHAMPTTPPAEDPATAAARMPCHPGDGDSLAPAGDAGTDAACPHCAGDTPGSQCHCCGYAAPTGLTGASHALAGTVPNDLPPTVPFRNPLPDSPGDSLFRPPRHPG